MWRDWICTDSLPDSSTIVLAYPISDNDTSNIIYRNLCFHLTNEKTGIVDTTIISRLKNAEALQQAANGYFEQIDVPSRVLPVFQALR